MNNKNNRKHLKNNHLSVFILGVFLLLPITTFGQTVMAGTLIETQGWLFSMEEQGSDSPSVLTQEILRNLETGMMDSLFDQGFICFNIDPEIKNEPLNDGHLSEMLFSAQSGGANRTLVFKGSARLDQEMASANQQVIVSGRLIYLDAQGRELGSAVMVDVTRANALQQSQRLTRQLLAGN